MTTAYDLNTPATEGRAFVAIGPSAWGKGATAAEALKNGKPNLPGRVRQVAEPGQLVWIVWEGPAGMSCGPMGGLNYPTQSEDGAPLPAPVEVARLDIKLKPAKAQGPLDTH